MSPCLPQSESKKEEVQSVIGRQSYIGLSEQILRPYKLVFMFYRYLTTSDNFN